jgi:hypothetical protein
VLDGGRAYRGHGLKVVGTVGLVGDETAHHAAVVTNASLQGHDHVNRNITDNFDNNTLNDY